MGIQQETVMRGQGGLLWAYPTKIQDAKVLLNDCPRRDTQAIESLLKSQRYIHPGRVLQGHNRHEVSTLQHFARWWCVRGPQGRGEEGYYK